MAKKKTEQEEIVEVTYPRIILGLDVSTTCIGISLIADFGSGTPEILKLTHVSPKVSKKCTGFEALLKRKEIFENEFLPTLVNSGITDVVIEEPLLSSNNSYTVATLLRFNGMICDAVYRTLGVVPTFISSYDARSYSFPDLMAIRKFNKKGDELPLKQIKKALKDNHAVLFGAYPYNVDKKVVMMNKVNELYPKLEWITNKQGDLKKENYDACDALVCALAYVNVNRHGIQKPVITKSSVHQYDTGKIEVNYTMEMWGDSYERKLILLKE